MAFRKFLFYQNTICFDWVMNFFLSWVMFSAKKVSFPAKTAVSRDYLKTKLNFQRWPKNNNVEFPGIFVCGLGISKGSNTTWWSIQGLSFVLSGISRGNVKKWKVLGGFKNYILELPLFGFFGNRPLTLSQYGKAFSLPATPVAY